MQVRLHDVPLCLVPGFESYVQPDAAVRLVSEQAATPDVAKIAAYEQSCRHFEPQCDACVHRIACGGFYDVAGSPEPP